MTIHTLGLTPALDVVYVLDRVRVGEIHRPPVIIKSPGGKSLNVARALTRLGLPVRAIVPLGGKIGDFVAALLAEGAVEVDRIQTAVETRLCITACDTEARTLTEFYEPTAEFDVPLDAIAGRTASVPPGEWLIVSGSVPAEVDPLAFARLLAADAARGLLLGIDVHGPALGAIIDAAHPQLVKVNRAEAAELTGESDAAMAARRLVDRGAQIAVVTDGEGGASASTAAGDHPFLPPVDRPGLFPVGSGDCFLAGLVGALDLGSDLATALGIAADTGSANAQVPGAATFDTLPLRTLVALPRG